MASSGTQTFNPTLGGLGLYALDRVGVRRAAVLPEHLANVAMAANLVLSDLSTEQPNLWKVVLNQVSLSQGTSAYTLPANVLLVMDCYIRTTAGGINQDRVLYPVSRSEYAAYPNKSLQEPPTVFWADRVAPVVLNLYPAPDGNGPYTLFYYAIQQDDDAVLTGAATLDLPYRFLKAFSDALIAELALTYDKENAVMFGTVAERSRMRAQTQDREMVPLFITPGLQRYYRG